MAQIMKAQLRTAHLLDDPLVTIVHSPIRQKAALASSKINHAIALLTSPYGVYYNDLKAIAPNGEVYHIP